MVKLLVLWARARVDQVEVRLALRHRHFDPNFDDIEIENLVRPMTAQAGAIL